MASCRHLRVTPTLRCHKDTSMSCRHLSVISTPLCHTRTLESYPHLCVIRQPQCHTHTSIAYPHLYHIHTSVSYPHTHTSWRTHASASYSHLVVIPTPLCLKPHLCIIPHLCGTPTSLFQTSPLSNSYTSLSFPLWHKHISVSSVANIYRWIISCRKSVMSAPVHHCCTISPLSSGHTCVSYCVVPTDITTS